MSFSKVSNLYARLSVHFSELGELRGLTFWSKSANQRLKFDIFLNGFWYFVRLCCLPQWSWISFPLRSICHWFDFVSKEKSKTFSNSTWSNQFCLCLENWAPHQDVTGDFSFAKEGGWWKSFPREKSSLDLEIYAKMIWTSFSTLKTDHPLLARKAVRGSKLWKRKI